jgi:hypothetical protein
MTEEELTRLTQEVPRRWLEYPESIVDFLTYETSMDPENVNANATHRRKVRRRDDKHAEIRIGIP